MSPLILLSPYTQVQPSTSTVYLQHFNISDISNINTWVDETGKLPDSVGGSGSVSGYWFTGYSRTANLGNLIDNEFTIEFFYGFNNTTPSWISMSVLSTGPVKFYFNKSPPESNFRFQVNIDNTQNNASAIYRSGIGYPTNQHCALVKANNVLKLFIQGVLKYQGSHTTTIGPALSLSAGSSGYGSSLTWIRELRISNTALYDTGFTPPSPPLTLI